MAATSKPVRPLANFPPSIWGDRFLSFSLDHSELEAYAKAIQKHKGELRRLIIDPSIYLNAKLHLIYSVYRLGLTYLFKEEINHQLDNLFTKLDSQDYNEADLYTVEIHFQVFRNHGYKMSSDVFNKFNDGRSGTFKEEIMEDVRGMLSLYESSQLRIRGEYILDEAFIFTQSKLKSVEKNTVEGNLARQVEHALERPFHRGIPLVEARLYLVNYEEECSTYDSLLKLAKTNFNYLQLLQKEELRIVTKWWKDTNFQVLLPYTRDRIPELYLWTSALFLEPCYSQARITGTKIAVLVLLLDDTCDAYATIEETRLLIHAIDRWEVSAIEQLPTYIRPFYEILLMEYADLDKQLAKEGRANVVNVSKQAFQKLATAYLQEAEWRHKQDVPSFEEYMKIGLTTSAYEFLSKSSLIGMGKIVTQEALDWYISHPKILIASELIARLQDDVMTFKFERERDVSVTGVEAYVKSFGVSESIAIDEINKMIDNAWKDINEGCLKPMDVEMDLLAPIVNLARVVDVTYKNNDGFTFPEKTYKEYIHYKLKVFY